MPPPHTHTLGITHGSAHFYWKRSAGWFIEQLLKLFYMRLYGRVTGRFKEPACGSYRARPAAFPQQHGLIQPRESHCELPFVPTEVARGLGIQLEQRAAMVVSGICSPHTHSSPCHRDAWSLSAQKTTFCWCWRKRWSSRGSPALGAAAHIPSGHWPCLNFSMCKLVCMYWPHRGALGLN